MDQRSKAWSSAVIWATFFKPKTPPKSYFLVLFGSKSANFWSISMIFGRFEKHRTVFDPPQILPKIRYFAKKSQNSAILCARDTSWFIFSISIDFRSGLICRTTIKRPAGPKRALQCQIAGKWPILVASWREFLSSKIACATFQYCG